MLLFSQLVIQTPTTLAAQPTDSLSPIPIQSYLTLPIKQFPNRTKQALEAEAFNARRAALAAQQAQAAQLAAEQAREAQIASETVPAPSNAQCVAWMQQAGINDIPNALLVINRESGCNPDNWNGKSRGVPLSANTSCGIAQELPCGKWPGAWNDPIAGLEAAQNYVMNRYGGWAGAWQHELDFGWY